MTIEFASVAKQSFAMGAMDGPHPEDGEGPRRKITLDTYEIATTTVSNRDFEVFVGATGYVTEAERNEGSQVFAGQLTDPDAHAVITPVTPWWRWVRGACWLFPDGGDRADPDLPVVHVSWRDAMAYSAWSEARLPTEAEWEAGAGDQSGINPHIWSGTFPDGPEKPPSPISVRDAVPNPLGLLHACGNVWEWTADRFTRLHSPRPDHNPKGPLNGDLRVVKGGSFLCSPSYCARFRPSSRRGENPGATTSHLGFRLAR
ncbi:MAG: formylglycine-generating enzyme family protein [Paracoccaceae bacterium]